MLLLFWSVIATILYTFIGYPVLVGIAARWWPLPIHKSLIQPRVTLLILAYNEAAVIVEKLQNSLALDYPSNRLTIIVVADGSNDDTVIIVQKFKSQGVQLYYQQERQGKIAAINRIMPQLQDEIVVFTDANAMLEPRALEVMVRNFADPSVAAVAGAKRVSAGGEGLYWRYESFLKQCDSRLSSVMGAAGELFAIRRDLFTPPKQDTILDDFVMSMRLVGNGWRVVYEPEAIASEPTAITLSADWERRTRNAAGGFQSIRRLPHLLHPHQGRVVWQYVSHRVLRWAVAPFLLPLAYLINLSLWQRPFYRLIWFGQTIFYLLAGWGGWRAHQRVRHGLPYTIFFFCFTNLAALAGFWRYVTKRQSVIWRKVR